MTYTNKILSQTALPAGFTVTAHSGAFDTPDNSIEFVEKAIAENCDILEMDVTFRPSGLPVIIHSGAPAETEGVPLEEAFLRIAKHPALKMNLDLKSTANLPAVDALLQKYGLADRAFYTGVSYGWAEIVKQNSAVPYYINDDFTNGQKRSPAAADAAAKKIIAAGALGLNSHYDDVSPTVVRAMRENGLLVSLWTANSPMGMRRSIALYCAPNVAASFSSAMKTPGTQSIRVRMSLALKLSRQSSRLPKKTELSTPAEMFLTA